MAREDYAAQVALLVRVLPYVAKEEIFALKGGTAINLFYRELPRLSVDIDLTYLPVKDRTESLVEINDAMDRIAAAIEGGITGAKAQRIAGGGGGPRVSSLGDVQTFWQKLQEAGKPVKAALAATARKLLSVLNSMVVNGTYFREVQPT